MTCSGEIPEWDVRNGMGIIYLYTFSDGMHYVGQTHGKMADRHYRHLHGKLIVDDALRNQDDWELNIIWSGSIEKLSEKEVEFIQLFDSLYPRGYNRILYPFNGDPDNFEWIPYSKKVYQYDLDGNFIAEYDSVTMAANSIGCNVCNISMVCDKNKTIFNSQWRSRKYDKIEKYERYWVRGEKHHNYNRPKEECYWYGKRGELSTTGIKIYQYDLDGNFVNEYGSMKLACEAVGCVNLSDVKDKINRTRAGHQWRSYKVDKIEPFIDKQTKAHPVGMYNLETSELIMKFNSVMDAGRYLKGNIEYRKAAPAIIKCCNGVKSTAYGYSWKYLE